MELIRFDHVDFSYFSEDDENNEVSADIIKNLNLTIEKGSFVAVLGHNGSGKSTIAKLINGILVPQSGTVTVNGISTSSEENIFEIRKNVGMVFQNPDNQIVASVVEEDVAFGVENLGIPSDECRRRVDEALKTVGMYELRKKAPHKLSGGQKQRVAIAGVMAMEPKCIVLDEPTAMLDPNGRKEVLYAVHELNRKKGVTALLITHYMEEVADADYVYVMDGGKVVLKGTPKQVFSEPELLQEYRLDVPPMTLLAHELRKAGLPLPKGILTRQELKDELMQLYRRTNGNVDHFG